MNSERIGFVGLGNMGSPMAQRMLDAGYEMVVHDVRMEVARGWNAGRCSSASLAEIADACDVVCLSLPTPDVVEDVVLGSGGLAAGKRVRRIVDLSTTGPVVSQALGKCLVERGKGLVDAPVSGGVAGARAGTLALMIACPPVDFEAVTPLLSHVGKPFHVGVEPGQGQLMKLLNNLLSAAALALTSEMTVMGVKAGLDARTMIDVFNAGSGRNSATQDKFPRSILTRRFDAGFSAGLMWKDVNLCLEQAERLGLDLPISASVREVWRRTVEEVGTAADFTSVVQPYERRAQVIVGKG